MRATTHLVALYATLVLLLISLDERGITGTRQRGGVVEARVLLPYDGSESDNRDGCYDTDTNDYDFVDDFGDDLLWFGGYSDNNEYEERILNSLVAADDDHVNDTDERSERGSQRQWSPSINNARQLHQQPERRRRRQSQKRSDSVKQDRMRSRGHENLQYDIHPLPPSLPFSSTLSKNTLKPSNREMKRVTALNNNSIEPPLTAGHSMSESPLQRASTLTVTGSESCFNTRSSLSSSSKRGGKISTSAVQRKKQQHAALLAITTPWVRRFLSSCHKDVLLPVPKDYCADAFNLVHLAPVVEAIGANQVTVSLRRQDTNACPLSQPESARHGVFPIYRQALKLLTQDSPIPNDLSKQVEVATTALYLLLHQRYVASQRGLDMVRRRFLLQSPTSIRMNDQSVDPIFGRCSALACQGMPLLPIGDSDHFTFGQVFTDSNSTRVARDYSSGQGSRHRANRYCASCRRVYYHWDSKVDGCAWGVSFCHLFLMVHGAEVFGTMNRPEQHNKIHVARIFGFPLHSSLHTGTSLK